MPTRRERIVQMREIQTTGDVNLTYPHSSKFVSKNPTRQRSEAALKMKTPVPIRRECVVRSTNRSRLEELSDRKLGTIPSWCFSATVLARPVELLLARSESRFDCFFTWPRCRRREAKTRCRCNKFSVANIAAGRQGGHASLGSDDSKVNKTGMQTMISRIAENRDTPVAPIVVTILSAV